MAFIRPLALALLVMTIIVTGCGGSKSSSLSNTSHSKEVSAATGSESNTTTTTSGKALSNSGMIAKADAVCARFKAKLAAVRGNIETMGDIVSAGTKQGAIQRAEIAELSKLTPSGSLASKWHQVLNMRRLLIEEFNQIVTAARANNKEDVDSALTASAGVEKQIYTITLHDGFPSCAKIS